MENLIKERILLTKESGVAVSLDSERFKRIMEIRRRVLGESFSNS